jgi:hypothetical protein
LLDFHQGVVGGIGTTQDVGLERIEQRDDLAGRVGAGNGDLASSMAAEDTTAAFSSLMAATRLDLSVVVRLARLPALARTSLNSCATRMTRLSIRVARLMFSPWDVRTASGF